MVETERGEYMDEIRSIREEINTSLAHYRDEMSKTVEQQRIEHREDIKELHCKIEKRFIMLSSDFVGVRDDVTTHKAHLKIFMATAGVIFTGAWAWVITHIKTGGGT